MSSFNIDKIKLLYNTFTILACEKSKTFLRSLRNFFSFFNNEKHCSVVFSI